jgi:hypothetical protein
MSERPVARDTMALLQENNKKFKFGIDNIRGGFGEIGQMVLEMTAQYQPELAYYDSGASAGNKEKTINFPLDVLRDGVSVELMASSELMNTEVRREIDLTLYQLLSDYMTKTMGMVMQAANPGLPQTIRDVLTEGSQIGTRLMKKIVDDFGVKDTDSIVLDATQAIATPPPPPMPMPGMPGMGGPGQGGMPPGMPPGGGGPPPPEISEQDLMRTLQGTEFGGR